MKKKPRPTVARPFKTDYAGLWCGYCLSRENAILAAVKHILRDGYSRATITNTTTGEDVARVRISADRQRAVVETVSPFLLPVTTLGAQQHERTTAQADQ